MTGYNGLSSACVTYQTMHNKKKSLCVASKFLHTENNNNYTYGWESGSTEARSSRYREVTDSSLARPISLWTQSLYILKSKRRFSWNKCWSIHLSPWTRIMKVIIKITVIDTIDFKWQEWNYIFHLLFRFRSILPVPIQHLLPADDTWVDLAEHNAHVL